VTDSNLGPISHRFSDTATYWFKNANSSYPSHSVPSIRVIPCEFSENVSLW